MTDLENWVLDALNTSKKGRVVFEAFGTPGVGKSYFCEGLNTRISKNGSSLLYHSIDSYHQHRFIRIVSKLLVILRSCWYRWDLISLACKFVFSFNGLLFLTRIKLIFNFLLVFSVIQVHSKKGKSILLDQAIFQGLWSCCYSKNTPNKTEELNILKPLIFQLIDALELELLVLIYVSASREAVINGLRTRKIKGSSELNSLQIPEIAKGIQTTSYLLSAISDILSSHPKIKIIEVPR
jgi:hypothetical protein